MARRLEVDQTSQVGAVARRWHYPFSHEANLLAYVLEGLAGEQDLYPRPWHQTDEEYEARKAKTLQILAEAAARPPEGREVALTDISSVIID